MTQETGKNGSFPPPGNDATIVVDPGEVGEELSAAELRRRLGLPERDDIKDYGELKTVGLGGMGAVFSGQEPGLMREVALKMLRPAYRWMPERISAFIREARTTAQISHPNIIPVHRIGVFEGAGVYFSMKLVRGETLKAVVAKLAAGSRSAKRRYSLRRLLEIFISACNGVAFAHHRGVIHCDLKPANLMVGYYGEVLVMDWGMAQCLESNGENKVELGGESGRDRPGTLGGTPAFMAPELLTGERSEPDQLTDIYSLGAILYSILTLAPSPYPTDLAPEELQKLIVSKAPVKPGKAAPPGRQVPRELEEIALKAMSRDRGKRYRNVGKLAEDVHHYLDGYPVRAYSPNIVYRGVKLLRRRPLIPLALLAALITLIGVRLYLDLQEHLAAENLSTLAEYNYREGLTSDMRLRRDYRELVSPKLADSATGEKLRAESARYLAATIDHYNSALELLGRIPDSELRRSPPLLEMYRGIFRRRLAAELMSRDGRMVRETFRSLRARWPKRFEEAVAADGELRRTAERINKGTGTLEIVAAPGWDKVELRHEQSGETRIVDLAAGGARPAELPAGNWVARFSGGDGRSIILPLRVNLALASRFELALPKHPKPWYAVVPAHEEMDSDGTVHVGGVFQISRTEVSIGEYLEFWRSLPPEKRKKCRAVLNADAEPVFLWDDAGKINPHFSPHQPVTGITGDAAREYCNYLSGKLECRVTLPRLWQWRRAARGVDGRRYPWGDEYKEGIGILAGSWTHGAAPTTVCRGDLSPYGVLNMSGNVREFALPSTEEFDDLVLVLGGSHLLAPRNAAVNALQFRQWSERGDDIGFRCVIEE
jgi:serine/threonine protein kinase